MKLKSSLIITALFFISFVDLFNNAQASNMTTGFNHKDHLEKVFKPQEIQCTHCHNFTVKEAQQQPTGKNGTTDDNNKNTNSNNVFNFNEKSKESTFRMPLSQICHECHRSDKPAYSKAPKTCFTCHQNMEGLRKIKPTTHENISWKTSHALDGRVQTETCLNCHLTSQCSECHLHRNTVEMKNHPRNFRFFHSVQARGQPQRCDSCHTKNYCMSCHLGK